jgi:ATP-dependent RNA helicase DeaD
MSAMRAVVLDEADEMLDMGFRDDLEYILGAAPEERRTLMFSATVPRMIATLAKRYQRDAVRVSTRAEEKQHIDIEYRALAIAPNDRENAIVNVLRYFEPQNALVFCSTRATVNHMTSRFANRGFSVVALSGELSQSERSHALQAMRDGRAQVCIATDVAARGIDLPNLELVIHADIPKSRESLVHRSGRTGRAGRKGVCALIVPYNQRRRTQSLLHRANIAAKWAKPPTIEEILARDDERLLGDPTLSEPLQETEKDLAGKLLAEHGAEQIAAAFVRLYRKEQTAPEELLDNAPVERGRHERRAEGRGDGQARQRNDFTDGVWFSLSIGRKQNAEPRWLLPMLCRAGGLTKRDIGAIRIDQAQTHVELAPKCVDHFLESLGPDKTMEKNIIVRRLDGPPKRSASAPARRYDKKRPFEDKKPFGGARSDRRDRGGDTRAEGSKRARPNRDDKRRAASKHQSAEVEQTQGPRKPVRSARPAASGKVEVPVKRDDEVRSCADNKASAEPQWNPLDASSKRPVDKKRGQGRDDNASGRPKRKKTGKNKLSPSKLRRAKAREQLSLKSGMAPRKRKKPKS